MRRLLSTLSIVAWVGAGALGCDPIDPEPGNMDHPEVRDPSLDDDAWLLSERIDAPTEAQKQQPVVLAAHGFQASTYEWVEFQRYAEARGVLFSNVLLGGHGRSTEEWVQSTWREWGDPLLDEYEALSAKGYENINVFCSSTGCTLTLVHLAEGSYEGLTPMSGLVMLAPFVVPQNELLYQSKIVGPFIWNLPSGQTDREEELFYHNRPYVVFNELVDAITVADNALAEGIAFPEGAGAWLYRADAETTVGPVTADKIIEGLRSSSPVELVEVPSQHHIFTRKDGRKSAEEMNERDIEREVFPWTQTDEDNYAQTFTEWMGLLGVPDALPVPG